MKQMKTFDIVDYFFHCVKDFFKLTEEECDLVAKEATDSEIEIMIDDMMDKKQITEQSIEAIKKYIPNYKPK